MNKKKLVLVEYYNTEPFLIELKKHQDRFELIRKIPSECTRLFTDKKAEIALIPVASYLKLEDAKIISNFGICCDGIVRTVVLFSNQERTSLKKIYLDHHSRTSVELLKIIVQEFWKLDVEFIRADASEVELKEDEGILMIGDKVFDYENKFAHCYDLGQIWKEETGLPFVFAVWVANQNFGNQEQIELERILSKAVNFIPEWLNNEGFTYSKDLKTYFEDNIIYTIGEEGKQAIKLFDELIKEVAGAKI